MNNILITIGSSILFFFNASFLMASIDDKLNEWFENQQYESPHTQDIINAQSAGYPTRDLKESFRPLLYPSNTAEITSPRFSSGCGGIDPYSGGFSAVNSDEFIANLRNIGQNSSTLAFMLALKIVSPQIEGTIEKIQSWSQKYLELNLTSCRAASQQIGGTMNYLATKQANCIFTRMDRLGEDWTAANYACSTGNQLIATETNNPNAVDFTQGNLTWSIMMRDGLFSQDVEFANLIMNIVGTIIITNLTGIDNGRIGIRILEPSIGSGGIDNRFDNIFSALLYGTQNNSSLWLVSCQNTANCLRLNNIRAIQIAWGGIYPTIENRLQSIITKIRTDVALDQDETNFISSSPIPIYQYLKYISSYYPNNENSLLSLSDYTLILAKDILLRSLHGVISKIKLEIAKLDGGIGIGRTISEYHRKIDRTLNGISGLKKENDFAIERILSSQNRFFIYEKELINQLNKKVILNAKWGG